MKRIFTLLLIVVVAFSLSACGQSIDGMVSQDKYDALQKQYDKIKMDYDSEVSANEKLIEELATLKADYTLLEIELKKYTNKPAEDESTPASAEKEDKYGLGITYYEEGQHKVGKDIPAGEYVLFAINSRSSGYFSVTTDANRNDIVFNDNFDSNSIITVRDGEYLHLSRCIAVPEKEYHSKYVVKFSDNTGVMLKVGYDISAGEYRLTCENEKTGYYCIYNDSRQEKIVSNDNFSNSTYVTIKDGQYLKLNRCYITD